MVLVSTWSQYAELALVVAVIRATPFGQGCGGGFDDLQKRYSEAGNGFLISFHVGT